MTMSAGVNKVVITFNAWEQKIREAAAAHGFDRLDLVFSEDQSAIVAEVADAQVALVGLFDSEILKAGENLRWIHACSGGINGMLFDELVQSDVPLTCLKPCFGTAGAEHVLAAMLGFTRRFHHPAQTTPMTQWDDGYDEVADPVDLQGSTVGIIGMGNMGQAIAQRAQCMGMRVLGLVRTQREAAPAGVDGLFTAAQRSEMLGQCDFVVIAVPLTEATTGMVDATFLAEMKSSAFLIDCSGRPPLLNYDALKSAIATGTIAGVSLQPGGADARIGTPSPDDGFWTQPNVVVTSCRGTSRETNDKAVDLFFENLRRLQVGKSLLGLVDKRAGY